MKWGSGLSVHSETAVAISEAADYARRGLDGQSADLVVVFAAPQHERAFVRLPSLIQAEFPGALVFGCSGGGIIGGHDRAREIEGEAALSITAASLPGVRLVPFHFELDQEPKGHSSWHDLVELGSWLGSAPRSGTTSPPDFLLLPDPFSCDIDALLASLDGAYPAAHKIGGVASGARGPGGNALFLGEDVHKSGIIGLALAGDIHVETLVAQGCRPIGTPLIITRCENNLLLEINGQPALTVLREIFESLSPGDQQLFRSSLFLGIQMKDDQIEYRHGDFLVRNLLGLSPERGAVVVGAQLAPYQAVQFHLRDANASAQDLRNHLAEHVGRGQKAETSAQAATRPEAALLFSCLGRGVGLYDTPDHDSRMIQEYLGPVPLGGFFCNGEIGPVGGQTFLHGYTSSIALFSRRPPSSDR